MAKNINLSASGIVATGIGSVQGVIVCSHTNGTLKLNDSPNSAAGRVILDTFTFAAGSQVILFPDKIEFYSGCFATVGGTGVSIEIITNLNVDS